MEIIFCMHVFLQQPKQFGKELYSPFLKKGINLFVQREIYVSIDIQIRCARNQGLREEPQPRELDMVFLVSYKCSWQLLLENIRVSQIKVSLYIYFVLQSEKQVTSQSKCSPQMIAISTLIQCICFLLYIHGFIVSFVCHGYLDIQFPSYSQRYKYIVIHECLKNQSNEDKTQFWPLVVLI